MDGRKIFTDITLATIVLVALIAVAYAGNITMPGGPTISVGSVRLSGGHHLEPVQMPYDPGPAASRGNQQAAPGDEDRREGERLRQKAMEAFSQARWAESIPLLEQALQKLPHDEALTKTLSSALIALRWVQFEEATARAARQRADVNAGQVTDALGVLGQALTSLRLEAGQGLVNQGEFEAAIQLPTRADFMADSSVVDLPRPARDRELRGAQAAALGHWRFAVCYGLP